MQSENKQPFTPELPRIQGGNAKIKTGPTQEEGWLHHALLNRSLRFKLMFMVMFITLALMPWPLM